MNRFKEFTEKEEERKSPFFFSAFLQSSVPDDMFSDIRRVAKGQELAQATGTPLTRNIYKSKDSMEDDIEDRLHGESSPFINNNSNRVENSDSNDEITTHSVSHQNSPQKNDL